MNLLVVSGFTIRHVRHGQVDSVK